MQGRVSRLVGQIVTTLQLWCIYSSSDMDLHPPLGGCYNTRAAPGSGVCRKARGGACLRHAEEVTDKKKGPTRVREAQPGCTTGSSSTDHCQICDVTIGDKTYCSQCKANYVPIDGTCTAITEVDTKAKCKKDASNELTGTEQVCGACKDGYFLHKGGCYQFGGEVGKLICADPSTPGSSLTAGACTTCAAGYFKNPTAAGAAVPPCIACNDTTGFADSTNTYKGVLNCEVCSPPTTPAGARADKAAVCTKCGSDKYLKDGTCGESSDCTGTTFPKVDTSAGNKCLLCGDATNGGIANCRECTTSSSTVTCTTCTGTNKPNTAKTACVPCSIDECASCDKENVCAACDNNKYLTPTGQCVDSCDKLGSYYADGNVCQPCSPECASCSTAGNNKCLSCPAGKTLQYTSESDISGGGSCVDECKTGANGCADCGAVIGGSKYYSRCSDTNQAPLNGNCAANTMRTQFCTNASNGACTQCANNYFLLDGGCYETSRQPGKSVCTTEGSGKCTQCANGMTADTSTGVCPACPAGCSKCSGSSTCTACLAGYYLSTNKCVKCTENSTNGGNTITGVPNCVSCTAPTSNTGTVTCYVTQTPAVDPADPSVNKGGLSSGAIAGISIAVIAVVGGLVGFLCWWFICRGKA